MSHHQQNFDEPCDAGSGFGVADVPLDGAEMEKRIPVSPTESVTDTADLDGIANTGYAWNVSLRPMYFRKEGGGLLLTSGSVSLDV
jgi:hypothetical protein